MSLRLRVTSTRLWCSAVAASKLSMAGSERPASASSCPYWWATPASIGSISAVVLAELQFGISLGAPSRRDTNQDALDRFLNMVVVEDWPAEVADFYGEPYSLRVACSRHRFRRRRLQRRAAKAPRKGTGPGTSEGEGEGSPLVEKTPISVPR